jgi:hypothetical protein
MILRDWGDDSSSRDRAAVTLRYGVVEGGSTAVSVLDTPPGATVAALGRPLERADVIGTALASRAFAVFDAVWLQDHRLAELRNRTNWSGRGLGDEASAPGYAPSLRSRWRSWLARH